MINSRINYSINMSEIVMQTSKKIVNFMISCHNCDICRETNIHRSNMLSCRFLSGRVCMKSKQASGVDSMPFFPQIL